MSDKFDQVEIRKLYDIVKESICPFLFPDEEFVHHSLPAFDSTGGPAIEFGRQIESNKTLLSKPVVLLSKLNPRTSRVSLADPTNDTRRHCCSTEFIAYKAKEDWTSNVFYKYFFQTDQFRIRLQNVAIGTTNSHVRVTPSETLDWKVPCPLKAEQTKIAEILSTVDQAIEQTKALIAKQQRIKTGLMQDLLTRGIDEYGNPRFEETHEFKDSPLGRIPLEWEVQPCAALCREIVVGIVIRPAQYYRLEGVPVLRSANVKENKITCEDLIYISIKDNQKLSKSCLREGDLVTVRTGYPGTTSVIPRELDGSNCVDLVILRPRYEKIRPIFLSLWVNSDNGKKQVLEGQGGLAQQHFNVGEMRSLLVKVPCINEQEKIESILISQCLAIEDLAKNLQKLHSLKTALMQDLLTGKKRVNTLLNEKEVANV